MTDEEVTDLEMRSDSESIENNGVSEEDAQVIARAMKNFKLAEESEREVRKEALEDYKFRAGQQWPEEIKNQRDNDKRPCLTVNQLPQFVNQIVNDLRQNRPGINVDPTGDGARVETADVLQGIIRHIEYASNADIAYDRAAEGQVTGGFGFFRIVTEYASKTSFDLEARIKSIRNPFSVYLDPSHSEPDGSDTNWGLIFDDISKDEFKSLYPNSKLSLMGDWDSLNNTTEGWVRKDGARIVEFFEKTFHPTKLFLLSNGKTILEEDLPKIPAQLGAEPDGTPIAIAKDDEGKPVCRDTISPKVMWYKLNAIDVLEKEEFPSQFIPIIPVYGTELIIEGERILEGIVRHARDPQRMYNFFASYEAETIALAPKAPWIGYSGQFEGHEEKWETANTRNHAFLEANDTSVDGKQIPLPTRNQYEPPVQAITAARMQAGNELKSTTGIYDPTLGMRSNEQSGVALQRRNQQSQTSNFHFGDNQSRSIRHGGRILMDMIPRVYDTPRAIRIIDEEDEQKIVQINQIFQEGGVPKMHDVTIGEYDVTVSEGPSYQTKRQEFVHSATELIRGNPQLMNQIGDLIVKNMDWPGAQAISDRMKKFLPPGIQDDDGKTPMPAAAKAQMAQMQQMIQQLTAKVQEQNQLISSEKLKLESKERIEYEKLLADFRIEVMRNDSLHAKTAFEQEIKTLIAHLNLMPPAPGIDPNAGAPGAAQPAPSQQPTGGPPPG
jgi:Phage P22-like portal protein